ncbi:malonyl-ACP O-methyltransferase BioC [Desulfosporosinus sp. BICA1-9]|uniref:malonyl-ACP O-methyltransferase BioC n=1 Tax=Desulfosporosinus sp. BICA1-9 TaxID=1531958 RepID=UPI000A4FA178|nr:malonyl-ACP O-methyltransferase BioC [Desulfosporosinus sp. BICA1-9]
MMVNKVQVQKNFGQSAATYDDYAIVQKEMARILLAKIKSTGRCFQTILEIGCGTGFFTELLAREYPKALITAIDIAPEMIDLAKEKLSGSANIRYLIADGEKLPVGSKSLGDPSFDLIVSNVVFQWFTDYAKAFAQYYALLNTDGYLIFSTLGAGTFKELYVCLNNSSRANTQPELICREGHTKREPFIENKCLQDYLIRTGFKFVGVEEVTKQEYFNSCREFLRALKKIGANNYLAGELVVQGMGSGIFFLIKSYDAMFSNEQGVFATYQCLFGWGQKDR